MSRNVLLGLLGLVLAVAVGFGVHLVTRQTISLPVARLEQAPALAPPEARDQSPAATTATDETETEKETETTATEPATTTGEDSSGQGRGRGRGRGGDSGPGGGGGDD